MQTDEPKEKVQTDEPKEKDINLEKYLKFPDAEIYVDPRPRIKNIVRELEEEHSWSWPPQPPPDYEKNRLIRRQKIPMLYSKVVLDICSILSLIIGPWELLMVLGFIILPKTFVPAQRESAEFCLLFGVVFLFQGVKHTIAGVLGLVLRSMKSYQIGFVYISWPYELVWPLLGIFISGVGFYTTQEWRLEREMKHLLKGYTNHWFANSAWDSYQSFMKCCGIRDYHDWKRFAAVLEINGTIAPVPPSCCNSDNLECYMNPAITKEMVHPWSCLKITNITTDIIFVSGTLCMAVAILLAIVGSLSFREAEDYVGDPIHELIFQTTSIANPKIGSSHNLRRQELLSLLDYYCFVLGQELGLDDEVRKVEEETSGKVASSSQTPSPRHSRNSDDKPKPDDSEGKPPEERKQSEDKTDPNSPEPPPAPEPPGEEPNNDSQNDDGAPEKDPSPDKTEEPKESAERKLSEKRSREQRIGNSYWLAMD